MEHSVPCKAHRRAHCNTLLRLRSTELGLDLYQNYGSDAAGVVGTAAEDEPLLQYNVDGTFKETNILLSFTEYKFLLTMLTAPKKDYDIAYGNSEIFLDHSSRISHSMPRHTRCVTCSAPCPCSSGC